MNKPTEEDLPFTLTQNTGFGTACPADDLLYPESFRGVKDDSATETQYFGFSIPEQRILPALAPGNVTQWLQFVSRQRRLSENASR